MNRILLAASSALALSACTSTGDTNVVTTAEAPAAPAAAPAQDEGARLAALFRESDEAGLKRNPLNALFRGDMRYADRFGDFISDEYFDAERAAGEADLAALKRIDRAKLNPTDKIAYDVFKTQTEQGLEALSPEYMALTVVRPMNHFFGFHTFYPTFASGKGAAPFKTVEDYDNNLKRHGEFVTYIDRAIGRFREGMASGVVETKLTVRNMIDQLDTQLKQKPEESSYFGPVGQFPDAVPAAERTRLTGEYRTAITGQLYPALTRLRDFLKNEYLPVAREGAGLVHMKGGLGLYRTLIEQTTTLPLEPDYVHNLGLSEVARIKKGMEEIKTQVGFKGTLAQFFDHLRTDPKFKEKSRESLTQRYYDIGKKVDAKIPSQFSTIPKAPLEIRPYEEFREKFEAGGSYQSGTPDGSRPGIFYFNAYDLPSRTTPGITTLYLHEGAPGHHFQISLAQENEALPAFMRFGGNTAYVEGWALYSETLGYEMGLFDDPYQRFGTLSDEMLRAMRLVVDSGIHAKGWTREQAIDYMLANSDMGRTDATAEVERYIAIPSQALAYKIGALTIQRLKKKAQDALGSRFDPREFHAQVLMTGALPMTVLEKKIDDWIAATKG
ncbi:MAG TPA: DUF885 domain-containing protein [Allosphingosinicella sp.]|jgi:uncharacterized protein (DUF885 family)